MFSGALEILWGSLLRQICHLKKSDNMKFYRILVRLNNHEGLKEDIEIEHKNISIIRTSDYEGFPFRCWRYHKYNNLWGSSQLTIRSWQEAKVLSETNKINTCLDPLVPVISFPKVGRFVKEVHEEEGGFGYWEILSVVEVRSLDTLI